MHINGLIDKKGVMLDAKRLATVYGYCVFGLLFQLLYEVLMCLNQHLYGED